MTPGRRFDPILPIALLLGAAFDAPFLDPLRVPVHDTFYNFINFHVFYGSWYFERALVDWYPYGALGLPSALQMVISFTPVQLVTGPVGALAGVRDAMLLFKVSVMLEHAVFVAGTVLLSRRLFESGATALVLGVAAAGCVVWWAQLWFELRFFYLLPLVLTLAVTFLQTRRGVYFWATGIACVAWAMGNVPYFAAIWAVVLLFVLGVPLLLARGDWRRVIAPEAANVLAALVFAASAAAFVYFGWHSLDGVTMREEGRDPRTGEVPLAVFLSHGGVATLGGVARALVLGWPVQLPQGTGVDTSTYVGLLPLLAFGFALVRERGALFLGTAAAVAFLVALSLGGIVTAIAYHVPGLSMYRHVGLLYGLVKVLLLIGAGFGLERLWRVRAAPQHARWLAALALATGLGAGIALVSAAGAVRAGAWEANVVPVLLVRLLALVAFVAASLALTRSAHAGAVLALVLDLALYQAAVRDRAPVLPAEYAAKLEAFEVRPLEYQPVRLKGIEALGDTPSDRAKRDATQLADRPGRESLYWITHMFTQLDPCWSPFHTDMWMSGVYRLLFLEKRRGLDVSDPIGCGVPKLRVVSAPTFVSTSEAAHAAVVAALAAPRGDAGFRDVIRIPAGVETPEAGPGIAAAGTVEVVRFTPDEVETRVRVAGDAGAWLVYADALHPGWRASVDGAPVRIFEANLAFKAVHVPDGEHHVRFWYRSDATHAAGRVVFAFGGLFGLGLLGWVAAASFPPRRS